ncbi:unnamed protein product [Lactuca saligna]|uniref:ATP-dependent DNA helicase n=1 Tax=Lactuca saligna TaxID=75948 RepID=A0AA36ELR9_LACSI|nr:unnamed protein product [Lactuca saligna]
MNGTCIGKRVYIPRMKFIHKSSDMPFTFSQKQFPLKAFYAMTINKRQGQSLRGIGAYLPQPVFSHGQLYVALSRATSPDSIKILIQTTSLTQENETKNVVFKDLLQKVTITEGGAIQILGQRTNQSYIESVLNVLECYTISNYSCPKLDKYQKFLENDFYIDVGLMFVIQNILDTLTIPKTWFRFVTDQNLIDLGETPPYYPDYIGVLSKIRDCTKVGWESYVLLILTAQSGSEIAINLWKDCIGNPQKFNRDSLHPPPATTVVAVTNLKPSISNGALRHGSSHATHIYVNPDIPETTSLINLTLKTASTTTKNTHYPIRDEDKKQIRTPVGTKPLAQIARIPSLKEAKNGSAVPMDISRNQTTLIISDATDTISATTSETSCRKLLKSTLNNFISNNPLTDGDTLPPAITYHKEETKKMSIQMLRGSSPDNIRFIIIDHETLTTMTDTSIPTTPAPTRITRKRQNDTSPEPSAPTQNVTRSLSYHPSGPTLKNIPKQTNK